MFFGNAEVGQAADNAACGGADARPGSRRSDGGDDWTGGKDRADARNCQQAQPYQQADHAADTCADSGIFAGRVRSRAGPCVEIAAVAGVAARVLVRGNADGFTQEPGIG